jgi:hypothetical protein
MPGGHQTSASCTSGKSHLPQRTPHRRQRKCQRSARGRSAWSGRCGPCLGVRPQQVMPAAPPSAGARSRLADRHIVLLRCCILLLYQARELWAQDFEFICLTLGGATGIRTPDLLHAITRQHVHPCVSLQVTVLPRLRKSARVRSSCGTFLLYCCHTRPTGQVTPLPDA